MTRETCDSEWLHWIFWHLVLPECCLSLLCSKLKCSLFLCVDKYKSVNYNCINIYHKLYKEVLDLIPSTTKTKQNSQMKGFTLFPAHTRIATREKGNDHRDSSWCKAKNLYFLKERFYPPLQREWIDRYLDSKSEYRFQ